MAVTVSFEAPQIQVSNSSDGIQLSQVILPYSIRNSKDFSQYLGGQMTLGQADGIKLTDNTKDWKRLGLAKIKAMVADAEIYVPEPVVEVPESPEATVANSEAVDSVASSVAPVSSADDSVASSESPVSSATAGSVASSAESQVTTAPSESTTEA